MQAKSIVNQAIIYPTQPARYVPALTGLRAVAAYLVFLHHYNPATPGSFAYRLFSQGYVGVSVFFVLSGFLLYHRYVDDYFSFANWSWRTYWQNRFARIFPLYTLLLGATVGVNTLLGRPMSGLLLSLNFTLLKGFFDDYKFSGIAQSWSLTVEVCFYGLAPLLFTLLRRWGAFFLTIGLLSIGMIWAVAGQLTSHIESTQALLGHLQFVFFYTFFGRAFEFMVGMWLARRWHQKKLPTSRYTTYLGLLLMAACVSWQASVPALTTNAIRLFWSEVVVYNYVLPVGIGVFFLGLLNRKSRVQQLVSHPVMQTLGRSSYAFYLIHIGVVANGLQKMGVVNHWLLFGLLVLMAHGLYVIVEKPFQWWLRAISPSTP